MFDFRFAILTAFLLSSCSLLEKEEPASQPADLKSVVAKPLSPEKTGELLSETGSNWFYGQGMGETALTAGAIFAFPPYALYVVGNGILSLSGYKQLRITDALPEEEREMYIEAYDSFTSGPGRMTSALAGREFRTKEVAKERIFSIIKEETNEPGRNSNQAENQSSLAVGG